MNRSAATRRTVLWTLGATAGGVTIGCGRATARRDDLGPSGSIPVAGATEAVVDDDGVHVYVAVGTGLVVVDVSDPATPSVVAERRELLADREEGPIEQYWDVDVSGDRLVLVGPANANDDVPMGVVVFDVSDPADPALERFVETDHGIHNAALDAATVYATGTGLERQPVVAYDATTGEELGRWSVLDVDPAWGEVAPLVRNCHDVHAAGDRLFVSLWDAGTWVVDAGDPGSMRAVGRLDGRPRAALADLSGEASAAAVPEMPGNHHNAVNHSERPLVAVGHEAFDNPETERIGGPAGIGIWDVSTLEDPERVATLRPPTLDGEANSTAHNFGWRGDRLYASFYRGGVRVYDLSDVSSPRVLGEWRDPDDASFWTARPARDGFVGSSKRIEVGDRTVSEAEVYVFPEPGDGGRPARSDLWPAGPEGTPYPHAGDLPSAGTATTDGDSPVRASDTPSRPSTDSGTSGTGSDGDSPTDGDGAGFGVPAALGAGALAVYRSLRRE